MAKTKGIGFKNVHAFVLERFGAPAWERVLTAFGLEERALLDSVVTVGWYDLELYARLIRKVDATCGGGDLRLVQVLGRFEAEKDLTTVHQLFLRMLRPSIAIEQMDKYWRRFHDTGEWTTKRVSDREILSQLTNWGVVDTALCRELSGYLGRTLELLGGRDVGVEHPRCRARGDATCEYRARWRLKKDAVAEERAAAESEEGEARSPGRRP